MKNLLLLSLALITCNALGMKRKRENNVIQHKDNRDAQEQRNMIAQNIRDIGMHLPYYKGDNKQGILLYDDKNVIPDYQVFTYNVTPLLIRKLRDTLRKIHTAFHYDTHYEIKKYFNNNNEFALIYIATDACDIEYYPESQYTTINGTYQPWGGKKSNRIIKNLNKICRMFYNLKF